MDLSYPALLDQLFSIEDLVINYHQPLDRFFEILQHSIEQNPELSTLIKTLHSNLHEGKEEETVQTIRSLMETIRILIPAVDHNGEPHPKFTTIEQIKQFQQIREGRNYNLGKLCNGDCKLQTLLAAFILNKILGQRVLISVRRINAHAVLFFEVFGSIYKVSFSHEEVIYKKFEDQDLFSYLNEQTRTISIKDSDYSSLNSILYFSVIDALTVLDCINLMRRCVVNYIYDPDKYAQIFQCIVKYLKSTGIYYGRIIETWEFELERVQDVYDAKVNGVAISEMELRRLRAFVIMGLPGM
jgi:hypothetical protein